MRVTVIGAGVAGLTTALELAERGCEVEVLERGPSSAPRPARARRRHARPLVRAGERRGAGGRSSAGRRSTGGRPGMGTVRHGSLVLAPRRDEPELERFARRTRRLRAPGCRRDGGARARPRRPLRPGPVLPRRGAPRSSGGPGRRWRARLGQLGAASASASRPAAAGLGHGGRLPRPCRPRPAGGPARGQGRDAAGPLPGRGAEPAGAAAASRASRSTSCRAASTCSWSAPP